MKLLPNEAPNLKAEASNEVRLFLHIPLQDVSPCGEKLKPGATGRSAGDMDERIKLQRRHEMQQRFADLDTAKLRAYYSKHNMTREALWVVDAIDLAKTGRYYLSELANHFGKSRGHVATAFTRVEKLKNRVGAGWKQKEITGKLVTVNGQWRLEL